MNASEERATSESEAVSGSPAAGAGEGLQKVTRVAMHLTRGSGSALALEVAPDRVVCLAASGEAPATGTVLDRASGISGLCLRTGELQVVRDAEADARVDAGTCRELGVRSLLLLPVRREGRVVGVLSVYSPELQKFSADDNATLEQLRLLADLASDSGPSPHDKEPEPPSTAGAEAARPLAQVQVAAELAAATASLSPSGETSEKQAHEPASRPAEAELMFRFGEADSTPGPRVPVVVRILLALSLAVVVWSERGQVAKLHWGSAGPVRNSAAQPLASPAASAPVLPAAAATKTPEPLPVNSAPPDQEAAAPADLATVGAVRYSLEGGSARAMIDVDREVYYRGSRLENPARAYFDLRGARLANRKQETMSVGQGGLLRVRISQYDNQTVRIVLDLSGAYDCSARFAMNPSRLEIAVMPRGIGR